MRYPGYRRKQIICGVSIILVTLISLAASSAENHQVGITVDGCTNVSEDEIRRIFGIELLTIAAGKKEVHAAPTRVAARCDDDRILLHAVVEHQDTSFYQTVPLTAEEADEDERLIAIAAAELVFSAWVATSPPAADKQTESIPGTADNSSRGKPRLPSPSSLNADDPSAKTLASKKRLPLKLEIGPLWRMYQKGPTHIFGGELSLKILPSDLLYLRTGVAIEGMVVQRPVGHISILAVSGTAAVGVLKGVFETLVVGVELGGRFGLARFKGESSDENVETGQVEGGFGGPMLGLSVSTSTHPYAVLSVELGYAFYGNIGYQDTSQVSATINLWVATGLAIGFSF